MYLIYWSLNNYSNKLSWTNIRIQKPKYRKVYKLGSIPWYANHHSLKSGITHVNILVASPPPGYVILGPIQCRKVYKLESIPWYANHHSLKSGITHANIAPPPPRYAILGPIPAHRPATPAGLAHTTRPCRIIAMKSPPVTSQKLIFKFELELWGLNAIANCDFWNVVLDTSGGQENLNHKR